MLTFNTKTLGEDWAHLLFASKSVRGELDWGLLATLEKSNQIVPADHVTIYHAPWCNDHCAGELQSARSLLLKRCQRISDLIDSTAAINCNHDNAPKIPSVQYPPPDLWCYNFIQQRNPVGDPVIEKRGSSRTSSFKNKYMSIPRFHWLIQESHKKSLLGFMIDPRIPSKKCK